MKPTGSKRKQAQLNDIERQKWLINFFVYGIGGALLLSSIMGIGMNPDGWLKLLTDTAGQGILASLISAFLALYAIMWVARRGLEVQKHRALDDESGAHVLFEE